MIRCSVCGVMVMASSAIYVGLAEFGDEEMSLCADCAALVFPGFGDVMVAHCPECSPHRFN